MKLQLITTKSIFLLVCLIISCDDKSTIEETIIQEQIDNNANPSKDCDEIADFPDLGPSAAQSKSCDDVDNPNNKGTLDCRTDKSVGGYENIGNEWGSYKVIGGAIRYDGTRTRVERFFKNISQGINKKTTLSGSLKIIDLSDGNTCIIQSHAGGKILKGVEAGSTNKSAQFLVYAKKTSNNKIKLETHVTTNPYTESTGGSRDVIEFATLNYNQEYEFVYETGYDDNGTAFSKIKIGAIEKYTKHTHTTEQVYTRYGAYGTGDSGDVTAHIEFKNVALCRD